MLTSWDVIIAAMLPLLHGSPAGPLGRLQRAACICIIILQQHKDCASIAGKEYLHVIVASHWQWGCFLWCYNPSSPGLLLATHSGVFILPHALK
jgi:hypothetical protein